MAIDYMLYLLERIYNLKFNSTFYESRKNPEATESPLIDVITIQTSDDFDKRLEEIKNETRYSMGHDGIGQGYLRRYEFDYYLDGDQRNLMLTHKVFTLLRECSMPLRQNRDVSEKLCSVLCISLVLAYAAGNQFNDKKLFKEILADVTFRCSLRRDNLSVKDHKEDDESVTIKRRSSTGDIISRIITMEENDFTFSCIPDSFRDKDNTIKDRSIAFEIRKGMGLLALIHGGYNSATGYMLAKSVLENKYFACYSVSLDGFRAYSPVENSVGLVFFNENKLRPDVLQALHKREPRSCNRQNLTENACLKLEKIQKFLKTEPDLLTANLLKLFDQSNTSERRVNSNFLFYYLVPFLTAAEQCRLTMTSFIEDLAKTSHARCAAEKRGYTHFD